MTKLYPSFIHQSALDPRFLMDNLTHVELVLRPRKSSNGCALANRSKLLKLIKDARSQASSHTTHLLLFALRQTARSASFIVSISSKRGDMTMAIKRSLVRPGGFILLSLNTVEQVDQALRTIDSIERNGVPLTEVPAWYWQELDSDLQSNQPPIIYTLEMHWSCIKNNSL